jgi:hypothetical protein
LLTQRQFIEYLVGLSGVSPLIRNAHLLVVARTRHSVTSVLTQSVPRPFLTQYTVSIALLLLARLLVGALVTRYHLQLSGALASLRCTGAVVLVALAMGLDPSSEHDLLAHREAIKEVTEANKEVTVKEVTEANKEVTRAKGAQGNVPVDISVLPVSHSSLQLIKWSLTRPLDPWYWTDNQQRSERDLQVQP